ncbi:MAG TPA: aldose epimerase family protein [Polyangiaceae bacterium]|nr:aldose epimerase family protein [Polyangiaceae bacterium]
MASSPAAPDRPCVGVESFGTLQDGQPVDLFVLTTRDGVEVRITNYGGIVVGLRTPDRYGNFDDIVLGFDRLEDYVRDRTYMGALIGRYANRVAGARLALGGEEFSLEKNDGEHHLHGGAEGFHKVLWRAAPVLGDGVSGVRLVHHSNDGEAGYPGNLLVTVTYLLSADGELTVDYSALSDRDTVVNCTQHSYFNLDGIGGRDILDHVLVLRAHRFTPTSADLIPTGEIRNVAGTAFDFTRPRRIGSRIDEHDEQLIAAAGYDHNYVLDGPVGLLRAVARASSPASGRVVEIATTEPGLQFYTGNALRPQGSGKSGSPYTRRSGFCLEPQHFPDSPNRPHFPSSLLRKGERFRSTSAYRFSTLDESSELRPGW